MKVLLSIIVSGLLSFFIGDIFCKYIILPIVLLVAIISFATLSMIFTIIFKKLYKNLKYKGLIKIALLEMFAMYCFALIVGYKENMLTSVKLIISFLWSIGFFSAYMLIKKRQINNN